MTFFNVKQSPRKSPRGIEERERDKKYPHHEKRWIRENTPRPGSAQVPCLITILGRILKGGGDRVNETRILQCTYRVLKRRKIFLRYS